MKLQNIFLILFISAFFTACFEEDERVTPHEPGDELTVEIKYSIYDTMHYFDCSSNQVIQMYANNEWHLGFETAEDGWQILLNSAPNYYIRHTGSDDFDGLTAVPDGYDWVFDKSDGDRDSTAIGKWVSFTDTDTSYSNEVILLGSFNGINYSVVKKFVFTFVDAEKYEFRFANLDGTEDATIAIEKDTSVQYTYFSVINGGSIVSQPVKTDWDLLFCQYSTILYDDEGVPTPYSVRGVLLNPFEVEVAVDSTMTFADISFADIENLNYSKRTDIIGWEWKDFVGIETGTYEVNPDINYFIRDFAGFYYKMRFINYYNSEGKKGYPVFEYQQL
jgi:hypothetical protein